MFHNPMMMSGGGGGGGYLLDTYTGSVLSLSTRRLRADTTDLFIVRRSNDDLEQSFSPEELGDIAAFCGAGSGYIKRWYFQNGSGAYAENTTKSTQPIIVNSGVLQIANSIPSVYFGVTHFLDFNGISGVNFTNFFMGNVNNTSGNKTILAGAAASPLFRLTGANLSIVRSLQAVILTGTSSVTANVMFHGYYKTLNSPFNEVSLNGAASQTNTTSGNYTQPISRIGTQTDGTVGYNGFISEVILFPSDMGADRAAITTEQMAYYGIT